MGRTRWVNHDLPPRVRRRRLSSGELYYYAHPSGRKEPLGSDYAQAIKRALVISAEAPPAKILLRDEMAIYQREYLTQLARSTQVNYRGAIRRMTRVFGLCGYDQIKPEHITQYMRLSSAKVRAKRDLACLSSFWTWAWGEGRTRVANPHAGLVLRTPKTRNEPVTREAFAAVYRHADAILQDTLDLLYLSGQDVNVVLGWRREYVRWDDGVLDTTRQKTGKALRIELYSADGRLNEFGQAVKRALERPRLAQSLYVVSGERGQHVTYRMILRRMASARKAAGVHFELRAIRRSTASDANSLQHAQELLGHGSPQITRRHYRQGEKVRPLK